MHKRSAFTLVELLVVVALIMIFVGLTLQRFSFSSCYVRSELDLLYQTCLYMQRHALVTRQKQILSFDLVNNTYNFDGKSHQLPKGVCFGIMPVKGPPSSPHQLLDKPCTFKNSQIQFHPDGIIDVGSIYLSNNQRNLLYALTVAVSPYSYLRTYCYADTWRLLK